MLYQLMNLIIDSWYFLISPLFCIVLNGWCPKIAWIIIIGIHHYFFQHHFRIGHNYFQCMDSGFFYIEFNIQPTHIVKYLVSAKLTYSNQGNIFVERWIWL